MRFPALIGLLLLAVGLTSCDGPTAGELSVELVTPSSNDAAILFKIAAQTSEDIAEVSAACGGCEVYTYRVSDDEIYCVVTGDLASGPLARIGVSHVGLGSAYTVEIIDVSGPDLRSRSTVGYELRLSR